MPAKFIGTITAPDEETALRKAVAELEIEQNLRNRLMAMRQGWFSPVQAMGRDGESPIASN